MCSLPKGNRFPKAERLNGKRNIEHLFSTGASFFQYPFKVIYLPESEPRDGNFLPKVLISVGKKRFKRATDRNKIKRKCKEAYRLHRKTYLSPSNSSENRIFIKYLCLLYTGKEDLPYKQIEKSVVKLLVSLNQLTNSNYDK